MREASKHQAHLRKVHHNGRSGEKGSERQSTLQRAAFCQMGVQKTKACEEAGQQDDEQGWFQPESEAQDRKQFDVAAPDSIRKSESGEEQQ